jgi:hypothetical protein
MSSPLSSVSYKSIGELDIAGYHKLNVDSSNNFVITTYPSTSAFINAGTHVVLTAGTAGTVTLNPGTGGLVVLKATAATQLTSATTGVTSNGAAGYITTVSLTNASNALTSFTVTNSRVSTTSVVQASINAYSGSTGIPVVWVSSVSSGSFVVAVDNAHATAALNGTLTIGYLVC